MSCKPIVKEFSTYSNVLDPKMNLYRNCIEQKWYNY